MIERYTREAMGRIWTEENKFQTWLLIETLACEAFAKIGQIPKKAAPLRLKLNMMLLPS